MMTIFQEPPPSTAFTATQSVNCSWTVCGINILGGMNAVLRDVIFVIYHQRGMDGWMDELQEEYLGLGGGLFNKCPTINYNHSSKGPQRFRCRKFLRLTLAD